jgi:hypothetical protein
MQSLSGSLWKLIEASAFDEAGRELPPPVGPEPMGFLLIAAERLIVAVSDGRVSLPPDAPPRAFGAYSGAYRFDGTQLVTSVDGASGPDFAGQQIRRISFEGSTRMVAASEREVAGRTTSFKFVWERVA